MQDPNWDKLLRYCADNGSYQGCPLPLPARIEYTHHDASAEHDIPQAYSTDDIKWTQDATSEHEDGGSDVPTQYQNDVEWNDNPLKSTNVLTWGGGGILATGWDDIDIPATGWDDDTPES